MGETLAGVGRILLAARIDAACEAWHLDERALPSLTALASRIDKPGLHDAVRHTARAAELFEAGSAALTSAMTLIEEYEGPEPAPATAVESVS